MRILWMISITVIAIERRRVIGTPPSSCEDRFLNHDDGHPSRQPARIAFFNNLSRNPSQNREASFRRAAVCDSVSGNRTCAEPPTFLMFESIAQVAYATKHASTGANMWPANARQATENRQRSDAHASNSDTRASIIGRLRRPDQWLFGHALSRNTGPSRNILGRSDFPALRP